MPALSRITSRKRILAMSLAINVMHPNTAGCVRIRLRSRV
jgi:hypothetical protein